MTVELTFQNFRLYLAEDDVLAIEEGCRHGADEELCVCLFVHARVCLYDIYICMCVHVYICMYIYILYTYVRVIICTDRKTLYGVRLLFLQMQGKISYVYNPKSEILCSCLSILKLFISETIDLLNYCLMCRSTHEAIASHCGYD